MTGTAGKDRVIRTVDELLVAGLVRETDRQALHDVGRSHAIAITPAVVASIGECPQTDPVALQYIPRRDELHVSADEMDDPIGDHAHSPLPGLVHRYPDRVLIKATLICPVYCRFCFRKTMVGKNSERPLSDDDFAEIFDYIASDEGIWEVILSGGDPLMLSPRQLKKVLAGLEGIPHVRVVRVHSRVPVAMPERVTDEVVEVLTGTSKALYVGVHANHANEFTDDARDACRRLAGAGVPMLGQSVLLKGVNDTPDTLKDLMRAFVENAIKPYYLHHLDPAPGTSHFRVSLEQGQALMKSLRGRVSGLCQPTYVVDIPGGFGKSPIGPLYHDGAGGIEDFQGRKHDLESQFT